MTPEHMARLSSAAQALTGLLTQTTSDATSEQAHQDWSDTNRVDLLRLVDELLQVEMFIGLFVRTWLAVAYGAYRGRGRDLVIAWQALREAGDDG